jgi:hypothetical protein
MPGGGPRNPGAGPLGGIPGGNGMPKKIMIKI